VAALSSLEDSNSYTEFVQDAGQPGSGNSQLSLLKSPKSALLANFILVSEQ